MFFPIGDLNIKHGCKPIITYIIIAINIVVFAYQFTLTRASASEFIYQYGCIPIEILQKTHIESIITSIFLHGGIMHLLGNMLFMWVFADNIEATIGNFSFLLFYLAGGIIATFTHIYFNQYSEIPCVGASGAIAACLGAYIVMFPHSKIRIFFILFFTSFNISALYFLGFWILQQFVNGIGEINTQTAGVAYWAHIGGFVFGLIMGFVYKSKAQKMVIE